MSETSGLQENASFGAAYQNRRKLWLVLAPVILILILVGSSLVISDSDDENIPVAKVKRGDVTIKITETGELRAQYQVTISAVNDKQILWLVPEGTWVEEGDTLIKYESEKYLISRGEASSQVQVAKADLIRAQSDLESMMAREQAARKNLELLPDLVKKGFMQESDLEQSRLSYAEMQSKVRAMSASVDAARANVERAERAWEQQDRKLRAGVTLAPRAGLVVYALTGEGEEQRKISLGMVPFEGMDLLYLPDVSSMLVDTELSEVDIAKAHLGMPVEIRLDAYPDTVFSGQVSYIADLAKRKISRITGKASGAKVFDVTVQVGAQDRRLKPGLTATLDVIVNVNKEALHIPLEGVFLNDQDQTIAYVQKKGKIETRTIVVKESNDRVAVVLEGLQEGEEILLARPNTI